MHLKPGTKCVIVAGCPENIGVIVEVLGSVPPSSPGEDAYSIKTVSGRPFHQLWDANDLLRGDSNRAITDRYKLRPLVNPKDTSPSAEVVVCPPTQQSKLANVEVQT